MTLFSFSDIENAYLFVSSNMYGMNRALVCKDTGKILYRSEMGDIDETEEEEDLDREQCPSIPHKNKLDLGRNLVFEFVQEHLPEDHETVRNYFNRKGAYSRYKSLLENRGMLKSWYDTEQAQTEKALREWCRENGVELEE